MNTRSEPTRGAWVVTGLVVFAFLVGQRLPAPGVDRELLAALLSSRAPLLLAWYGAPIGGMILPLVAFRGLAALFAQRSEAASERASRIACGAYLALGLARGFWSARGLEWISGTTDLSVLGFEPGLGFRLLMALSFGAGAAIDWWLASTLSTRGIGRGPLVLAGAALFVQGAQRLAELGLSAGRDGFPGVYAVIALGAGLPAGIILLAASRRGGLTFPISLRRGFELETGLHLVILPYLFGSIVLHLVDLIALVFLEPAGLVLPWLREIDTLAALAVAAGISVWIWVRGERGFILRRLVLGVMAPVLAWAPVAGAIALDRDATWSRLFGAHRGFEGDVVFEVLLSAEDGDGSRDAPILAERLAALGVTSVVLEAAPGRIRLRLIGSEEVDRVLTRVLGREGATPERPRDPDALALGARAMSRAWSVASFGRVRGEERG